MGILGLRLPGREDVRSMLSLAAPIALMQTGLMLYGLSDTLFLGRVSAAAIAGVGVANAAFHSLLLFGIGFLLGIDTLSSRAFGAGKPGLCAVIGLHAAVLAVLVGAPLVLLLGYAGEFYRLIGVEPSVAAVAVEYLGILRWMTFFTLIFVCCRQYLQSMNITRPLLWAIAAGNVLNVVLNYGLIFGKLGLPALGIRGCAFASVGSCFGMMLVGVAVAVRQAIRTGFDFQGWRADIFKDLSLLGIPSGLHLLVEVSVFALTTMLMGRFGSIPTAGHQIALSLASLTFMVPLGVSIAAAVRVGQGIGRGDPEAAVRAGDTALVIGVCFMAGMGVVFVAVPSLLIRLFTADSAVIAVGVPLLYIAAAFQIFDGMQVTLMGLLRGLGLPKITLYTNLGALAFVGLPLGYWLAFHKGLGPRGLWFGLLVGLSLTALVLYFMWRRRAGDLIAGRLRAVLPDGT